VPVAHLRRVAARASRRLPVHGEATEVWLIALGSDGWSLLHRFRLMGIGVAEAPSSLAISGGRSPLHSLPTPVNTSFGGRGDKVRSAVRLSPRPVRRRHASRTRSSWRSASLAGSGLEALCSKKGSLDAR